MFRFIPQTPRLFSWSHWTLNVTFSHLQKIACFLRFALHLSPIFPDPTTSNFRPPFCLVPIWLQLPHAAVAAENQPAKLEDLKFGGSIWSSSKINSYFIVAKYTASSAALQPHDYHKNWPKCQVIWGGFSKSCTNCSWRCLFSGTKVEMSLTLMVVFKK